MGEIEHEQFVEQMTHWHERLATANVRLAKTIVACPSRNDDGPHLPRFGPDGVEMHCTYCAAVLVAV